MGNHGKPIKKPNGKPEGRLGIFGETPLVTSHEWLVPKVVARGALNGSVLKKLDVGISQGFGDRFGRWVLLRG